MRSTRPWLSGNVRPLLGAALVALGFALSGCGSPEAESQPQKAMAESDPETKKKFMALLKQGKSVKEAYAIVQGRPVTDPSPVGPGLKTNTKKKKAGQKP